MWSKSCFLLLFSILFIQSLTSQSVCDNRALDFDGTDDWIQLANSPVQGTVPFTIECWFLSEDNDGLTGCSGNFERIIGLGGNRFELGACGNTLAVVAGSGTANLTSATIVNGAWYHLAATYSTSTNLVSVYLNGSLVWWGFPSSTLNLDNNFRIGRWPGSGAFDQVWKGRIDDLRIWNYARSRTEIRQTMNCELKGNEAGLVDYYNFNQGVPNGNNAGLTTLLDIAGTPNNGTLFNFGLSGNTSNWVCRPGTCRCDCSNNLVQNPGFFQGAIFGSMCTAENGASSSWICNTATPQIISIDSACDAVSLQMWGNRDVGESVRQTGFIFTPGRTYQVSFFARFLDDQSLPTKYVRFGFRASNGGVNPYNCTTTCAMIGTSANITSQSWAQFTLPAWTATGNWTNVIIYAFNDNPDITGNASTVSWGRIDNICIQDVTPALPCVADFTFQPIGNCGNVQFTNTSTGPTPLTYSWNFGDGSPLSVVQNPAHQYTACGTYQVCLTISSPGTACNKTICKTVNITDAVPPIAKCVNGIGVLLDANCTVTVTPGSIDGGSTDNCKIQSMSLSPNTFTQCGIFPVTLTVTDWCGNTSSCNSHVQVHESVPPVITCPPNLQVTCHINVLPPTTGAATATDNCDPNPVISYTDLTTNLTPCVRVINRTWTAVDACGNSATCQQVITVADNVPPVAICVSGVTVQLGANCTVTVLPGQIDAGSYDNCQIKTLSLSPNIFNQCGTFPVTLTVTDWCGNSSSCTSQVNVQETVPPVIVCPPNLTKDCNTNLLPPATGTATATDNCTPSPVISYSDVTTGVMPCNGLITRTWKAMDACGNSASCQQLITVLDNIPPVILNCPKDTTITGTYNAAGICSATIQLPIPAATDNCDINVMLTNSFNGTNNASGTYPSGTTGVTFTAADDCGNKALCSFKVNVVCPPKFNCDSVSLTVIPLSQSGDTCCYKLYLNNTNPALINFIKIISQLPVSFTGASPAVGWGVGPSADSLQWALAAGGPLPTGTGIPMGSFCIKSSGQFPQTFTAQFFEVVGIIPNIQFNLLCTDTLLTKCSRCVTPPQDMVAWWPMDETSGTTVIDIVGGNNGTAQPGPIGSMSGAGPVSSATWPPPAFLAGKVGTSLFFTGNRYISVPSSSSLEPGTGGFTVDAWVNFAITPSPGLLNIAEKLANTPRWQFYISYPNGATSGQLNFQVRGISGGLLQSGFDFPISPQGWHHVAVTLHRGTQDTVKLYVNGVLGSTRTFPSVGNVTNSSDMLIGTGSLVGREIAIDELEIFNRALTQQEIQSIWAADNLGKCAVGSICGVKFNDLNGNGIQDQGEPGLPGWTINLSGTSIATTITGPGGNYCFSNLVPGTYHVCEVLQSGWTTPRPCVTSIFVGAGQAAGVNFGNRRDTCIAPPQGMVAWWPLDEPNGASIVNDIAPSPSSTSNNQGTPKPGGLLGSPNGPDAVTGRVNGALYFAGPYLEVPSQADVNFGTGDFTIDAWIKPVSLVDANFLSLIVHKIDATSGVGYALYTLGNGSGGRTVNLVLNSITYTSSPGITSTAWHHVAVVVKRSSSPLTGTFYINGAPTGTFTPVAANLGNASPLLIGASFVSGLMGLPNVGRHEIAIDELEIFKRALDSTEVRSIWAAGSFGKCKPTQDSCCRDKDLINQTLANAINVSVDNNLCKATLNIGKLPDCYYIQWVNWGDNNTSTGPFGANATPMHTYTQSGTYIISYLAIVVDPNTGFICFEKIVRDTITIRCPVLCPGCAPNAALGPNLIVNGDFSAGNTGFTSAYTFKPAGGLIDGEYSVRNSTTLGNPQWAALDHTAGLISGNFLACDGSTNPLSACWQTTLVVEKGSQYNFCVFANNLVVPSKNYADPVVEVLINGVVVATATLSEIPDMWVLLTANWTANSNTALIQIRSADANAVGNDFALDDISFIKCSYSCCKDYELFSQNVVNSISVCVEDGTCKATVKLSGLPKCNSVFFISWGDGHIDWGPFSNDTLEHTYSQSGAYTISVIVFEYDTNGKRCFDKILQYPVRVNCKRGNNQNLLKNPGFYEGVIAGSLCKGGNSDFWKCNTQAPQVIAMDSCCDGISLQMWGNLNKGGSVRQSGFNFRQGQNYQVTFSARFLNQATNPAKHIRYGFVAANGQVDPYTTGDFELIGTSPDITSHNWATFSLPDWTPTGNWTDLIIYAFNDNPDVPGDETTASWGRIDNIIIYEEALVDAEEAIDWSSLLFYPNPVSERLYIAPPREGRWTAEIWLTDGRLAQKQSFFFAKGEPAEIDVSSLRAGIYFVKIMDEQSQSVVRKFVKQ